MRFKVVTAVATEPVTRVEAKSHLRVDSTTDDALIDGLITAAREFAEHYTGRALAPQTLEVALDEFPACNGEIELPMPPVNSITSIVYTDADGTDQTLAADKYALSTYGLSRTLALTYGNDWPTTREIPDAVCIVAVCGYVACPKAAKSAMLLLIGHLYENRETVNIGNIGNELPLSTKALLDTVKVYGF